MRVLVCHNRYRSSLPSGEDMVAERELAWLRQVPDIAADSWFLASDDLLRAGWLAQARAGLALTGDAGRRRAFVAELRRRRPDLLQIHNLWPLFTFDLVQAAAEEGIPVVLTLHNHRLIATNQRRVLDGRIIAPRNAEERTEILRLGTCHGRLAEFAYRRMLTQAWQAGWPQRLLDTCVCLSRFQQDLVVGAGIARARTVIRAHACPDPGVIGAGPGDYALFVGRLDRSKGIVELAETWEGCGLPLKIVGSGPEARRLAARRGIEVLGRQPPEEVARLMAGARFVAMNSQWHETFGLVLIESFACGTPCLVPDLGAPPEIVQDGVLGRVFRSGDRGHLIQQARRLWDEAPGLRPACRLAYETRFTPAIGVAALLRLYETTLRGGPPGDAR